MFLFVMSVRISGIYWRLMFSPTSRVSFHNDPFSRTVMRSLLLLQLGAMFVVLRLCLSDRFVPAMVISLLTLVFLLAVFGWLFARYRGLPVVREKRNLRGLVKKFDQHVRIEELRIYSAIKERARLVQAEKQEIHSALRKLQTDYIEDGLRNASIEQASITGIEPALKQRLAGYGILCAADVSHRITQLPGFGVEKCHALLGWRSDVKAELESTKPADPPPEQLDAIKQRYYALQDQNNAAERKAISSQQLLEHELMSLKPRLRALRTIRFSAYLSRSLASRGDFAALVAFVLVLTQVVSSLSVTLAFAAGK